MGTRMFETLTGAKVTICGTCSDRTEYFGLELEKVRKGRNKKLHRGKRLRPVPNAAPLMCRTKLNTVRLWSDFGATADSDGVLASDLIREGHGKYFSMRKICDLNSLTLSK